MLTALQQSFPGIILPFLVGCLCGSIPFGYLIARQYCGIDPRTEGSKNIGATNIARVCGKKWGALTLLCDLLKGFLPIVLVRILCTTGTDPLYLSALGIGAIAGHIYSPFLLFKGGKGVATTVGVFLALAPLHLIGAGVVCLTLIWLTGFVSLGSLSLAVILPASLYLSGNTLLAHCSLLISLLIIIAHRENIRRLLAGTEKPWNSKKSSTEQ